MTVLWALIGWRWGIYAVTGSAAVSGGPYYINSNTPYIAIFHTK